MRRVLAVVCTFGALTACSGDDVPSLGVVVGATDCVVAPQEIDAGRSRVDVTNDSEGIVEVHVYEDTDVIVGEVEGVAPGGERDFDVDLAAGEYSVECRSSTGTVGGRTPIVVSGSGGPEALRSARSVPVVATDYRYDGLAGEQFSAGTVIEITMRNAAAAVEHELELFGPDGRALREIGPTAPGETGRVVVSLDDRGVYEFVCGIDGHEELGMTGSFRVG